MAIYTPYINVGSSVGLGLEWNGQIERKYSYLTAENPRRFLEWIHRVPPG